MGPWPIRSPPRFLGQVDQVIGEDDEGTNMTTALLVEDMDIRRDMYATGARAVSFLHVALVSVVSRKLLHTNVYGRAKQRINAIKKMGPPKKRPPKVSYSEYKRRLDIFEYRWDKSRGSYYLYNPWTGETIFSTNLELLNRQYSMWGSPEKYPSKSAQSITLFPESYASRRWGRRKFHGWGSPEAAATQIAAVARGFLARVALRKYYGERYYLRLDPYSGYYYFFDTYYPDADTTWYKPRLAFFDDIRVYVPPDADDYMQGNRYSKLDFRTGPLIKVMGLNKYDAGRSDVGAFIVSNPDRVSAIHTYDEIGLENIKIGDDVIIFDGFRPTHIHINEYHLMRAAICGNNWLRVVDYMRKNKDNLLIQLYGFHCFAKTEVPVESSGVIDYVAQDAVELAIEVLRDPEEIYSQLHKIYAMRAFYNIFSVRAARAEYLNQDLVTEQGEFRATAVEEFLKDRLGIFNQYLKKIPNETINMYERGEKEPRPVVRPLPRSVEMVESALECMSLLAHEIESKEVLSFICLKPLNFALKICNEFPGVMRGALRLLYNLCYRCESGQEAVLLSIDTKALIESVRHQHSGDLEVMRLCRRFELALTQDGWRGNVEELIEKEMNNEALNEEYLKESTYGQEGYTA